MTIRGHTGPVWDTVDDKDERHIAALKACEAWADRLGEPAEAPDAPWIDTEKAKKAIRDLADNVRKPSHYNQTGIECIDAIRAALGDGFEDYLRGNVMKYLWRYKYKNGVEDLEKAQVYLGWLIKEQNNEKV